MPGCRTWQEAQGRGVRVNKDSPQASRLRLWYPLSDTTPGNGARIHDHSGYNGHGTGGGVTPGRVVDSQGACGNFASSYINLVSVPLVTPTSATLSVWLKLNAATPASDKTGFAHFHDDAANPANSHYPWTDGTAYIVTLATVRQNSIALSSAVTRTEWHLVTVTNDAGAWKFYQNDILVSSATKTLSIGTAQKLGQGNGAFSLDGLTRDWRYYERALSQAEVAAAYDPATRYDLYWRKSRSAPKASVAAPAGAKSLQHIYRHVAGIGA